MANINGEEVQMSPILTWLLLKISHMSGRKCCIPQQKFYTGRRGWGRGRGGERSIFHILRHNSYYSKVYPTRYGLLVSQMHWIVPPKGTINIIILIVRIYKHKILQLILTVRHISLFCVIFTNNTTKIKENLLLCLRKQISSVSDPYWIFYQLFLTFIEQCSSFNSFSFTVFKIYHTI